ncbi:MAG: hypothetical protein ACPGED_07315 [Flavobacteriales bacterium]
MKTAEVSKNGFLLGRPHDLHLINFSLAISLVLIPLFPSSLWFLSAVAMILVQAFNSASKPVVGETLYRLGVLTDSDPNKVFALANMWRRIGNATIGASTPLIYSIAPNLSFYIIGGIMMVFLVILMGTAWKIKSAFQEFREKEELSKQKQKEKRKSLVSDLQAFQLMEQCKCGKSSQRFSLPQWLSMRSMTEMTEEEDYDEEEAPSSSSNINEVSSSDNSIEDPNHSSNSGNTDNTDNTTDNAASKTSEFPSSKSVRWSKETIVNLTHHQENKVDTLNKELDVHINDDHEAGYEQNEKEIEIEKQKQNKIEENKVSLDVSGLDHFLIVHAFSFWDAAISRLPFAFLTIAISSNNNLWVASVILFAYQMSRAIAQSIQAWRCTPVIGYILNGLALITHIVLVTYLAVNPEGKLWYVPFAFAGLAETLPIQQYYLVRLYNSFDTEDDMRVRHAVKASHTGTGVGSMAAFVVTSQIYSRFGLKAVSYLGLSVQIAKILTNISIDLRYFRNSGGEKIEEEVESGEIESGSTQVQGKLKYATSFCSVISNFVLNQRKK